MRVSCRRSFIIEVDIVEWLGSHVSCILSSSSIIDGIAVAVLGISLLRAASLTLWKVATDMQDEVTLLALVRETPVEVVKLAALHDTGTLSFG